MSDGRYRRLYAFEWHHPAFRRLADGARIVRLYCSAGPQTTSVGCFRLSSAVAVEDLGGTADEFEARLDAVCDSFGWAWDPVARVLWMRDWCEMNPPASPNVVASWAKLLRNVPVCDVRAEAIASINKSLKNLPASFREPWLDLLKSFRGTEVHSEVHSEVRSETNQGSGIRDQGSEIRDQARSRANGSGGRKSKGVVPEVDDRVIRMAEETIRDGPRNADTDYLIDALQVTCRQRGMEINRAAALVALTASQRERTA